jgi:putative flippase GtrA
MGKKIWLKLEKNQVIRFILSAGVGFLVDVFSFYIFYHFLFTQKDYRVFSFSMGNYTLSLAISFFLGVAVNFLITKYLVFTESVSSAWKQAVRFGTVAIIGFFANLGMIEVFIHYFNMYPPVARPLAALSLFFASYFVHKFFSFSLALRHQHKPKAKTSGA